MSYFADMPWSASRLLIGQLSAIARPLLPSLLSSPWRKRAFRSLGGCLGGVHDPLLPATPAKAGCRRINAAYVSTYVTLPSHFLVSAAPCTSLVITQSCSHIFPAVDSSDEMRTPRVLAMLL